MQLLKKSDIIEEGNVTFTSVKKCHHCSEKIKSRTASWKVKFYSKGSSIYIHLTCKESFYNTLRQ